jgi:hypothetical protein
VNLRVWVWKSLAICPQENVPSSDSPLICAGGFNFYLAALKDGFCTALFDPPCGIHLLECKGVG